MKEAMFGFVLGGGTCILSGYGLITWQFWAFVIPVLLLHHWAAE